MSDSNCRPSICPVLFYRDARSATTFLTEAFGFTAESSTDGPDGRVMHAELSWDGGIVMLSSVRDGAHNPPAPAGVYVAVSDPDAHHDRAAAAGAKITMSLTDQPYG